MAATLLADLGADVIKVERAGRGDFSRGLTSLHGVDLERESSRHLLWASCNRNKRAIGLDLRHADAAPVFRSLIETADIFVTNLHPEALDEMGADEATVKAANPTIVYARGSGLGEAGARALDPCQDTVGMAYSGFMFTTSVAEDEPNYPPGALSDVLSGTMLAFGVLAALRERDRTGQGQTVTSSQLQSLLWLQSLNLALAANFGKTFEAFDRTRPSSPYMNTYRCGDGRWIALGLVRREQWVTLLGIVGLEALSSDERFITVRGIREHGEQLVRRLQDQFATADAEHWLEAIRGVGLWVSPVNRLGDLATDEQVLANGYAAQGSDGWVAAAMPFSLQGYSAPTAPSPEYGADTMEVLKEIGYTPEEVVALQRSEAAW
jgi:crotonobetainyl-CoA:carnitine CoA-transferase CaiB-like acyl-CoA transferase